MAALMPRLYPVHRFALQTAVLALLVFPVAAQTAPSGTFATTVDNTTSPPSIVITYTPTVDCNKIILIQTVKPTLSNADGSGAVDCPFKDWNSYEINDVTTVATNTSVDHNFCEKDPGYNGDDDPQDKGASNQQGSKVGAAVTDSKIRDAPHADVPKNGKNKFTAEFETCAVCADDGSVMGCMTWKYENTNGGAETITVTGGTGGGGPLNPSATFGTAVTKFKDTHKDAGGNPICPEKVAADAKQKEGGKAVDVDPVLIPPQGQGEDPSYLISFTFTDLPGLSPLAMSLLALLLAFASFAGLRRRGFRTAIMLCAFSAIVLAGSVAQAATCVSFPSIVGGSVSEYSTYEMKFSWVGEQAKTKPTLGIAGSSRIFDFVDFSPCVLAAGRYKNDGNTVTLTLSDTEWDNFMSKLSLRPEFQWPGSASGASLSMQILKGSGPGTLIFEHVTNKTGTRTILLLLIDSLSPGNTAGHDKVIAMKRVFVGACLNCGQ